MRLNHTLTRWLGTLGLAVATTVLVAACGGGDGNSPSATINTGTGTGDTSMGGGNGSAGGNGSNQVAISVNAGIANVVNMPTVSVTLCAPGSSTCQTIPNVLVDTASYGVRIVASAAGGVVGNLPTTSANNGGQLAECGKFVSSYTWGSVRTADVKIGGQVASSLPIQLIGDLGTGNVPSNCTNNGSLSSASTAQALGANGILGIGPAPYDCGASCVASTAFGSYYSCPNGNASCQATTVTLAQQVANPVPQFPTNNNGVIVAMGTPSGGTASGTLTFGISSSALGGLTVLQSTTAGDVTGTLNGRTMSTAFFDTGSNAYFFGSSSSPTLPICSGNASFYCPSGTTSMTATVTGLNNTQATLPITVANANALFNGGGYALANLAGPFGNTRTLDFGLPHFYGRTLYFGMDLTSTANGQTPYVAF
ncbi:DUF3443 domain-containing protein [Burkholderia alba]|uniref:DUF3443 domain-containing protein n=1 Tax=Burkholderia alba TaxID=2683677 RepID=UPI002B05E489|nr:DUF3443 domain-containing protein [Burkholderia alba]